MARWGMLSDVVRAEGRALAAALAALLWAAASLGALLLARHDWVWVVASLGGAALLLALKPLRPYRKAFALVALGLPLGVASLEAAIRYRVFGPDALARASAYAPSGLAMHMLRTRDEGGLMYGPIPGHVSRFMGHDLRFNSLGCRGAEPPPRAPGRFLLVATGTSITMGAGVAEDQAFSTLAGARVARDAGVPVDVLNCGTPSYALPLILRHAEYMARTLRPDAVVIEVAPNALAVAQDVEAVAAVLRRGPTAESAVSGVEHYSFAATALYPPADLRKRVTGLLPFRPKPPRPARAVTPDELEDQLRSLAALGKAQGFRVYAFFLRPMNDFAKPDAYAESRQRFRRACEEAGVEIADAYPHFQADEFSDEFIVFPGDLHPNARAHARFADALVERLRPQVASYAGREVGHAP